MDSITTVNNSTTSGDSHHYHHLDPEPRMTIEVERNSRGTNWHVTIANVRTVEQAEVFLGDAIQAVKRTLTEQGLAE